ncbi:GntR family transcriptional regulator, partial [bacterium]
MKKVMLATQLIEKHIAQANNTFDGFPSERQLAENLGLSRDTVRTAVKKLTEQGTLTRKKNGRLKVADASDDTALKIIGFATPINSPGTLNDWKEGVAEAFEGEAFALRPVAYSHWADPVIQEALHN